MEEKLQQLYEKRNELQKRINYIKNSRSFEEYSETGMILSKTGEDNFVDTYTDLQNELYALNKTILETEINYFSSQGRTEEAEKKQQEYDEIYNKPKTY